MDKSPETTSLLATIVTAIITFFTGGGLVKVIQNYQDRRREEKLDMQADAQLFREMLLERVSKLEKDARLNSAMILELTKENAALKAENLAMRRELEDLKQGRSLN